MWYIKNIIVAFARRMILFYMQSFGSGVIHSGFWSPRSSKSPILLGPEAPYPFRSRVARYLKGLNYLAAPLIGMSSRGALRSPPYTSALK